jgi:hypothetical protein
MVQRRAARRIASRFGFAILATAWLVVVAVSVIAQESPRGGGSGAVGAFPRLPDAATRPPDWIGPGAPFNVAAFFAAPARDRNAAPLYLDAFFEFSPGMERCFPPGPERDRRRDAAAARRKRYDDTMKPAFDAKTVLSPAQVDEIVRLYDVGFRKVAEAQRRDRCVFETSLTSGFGPDVFATTPHLDSARMVARVASLRVQVAVQRGDFERAIVDVETVLRLAGDLRPRGGIIPQLISSALEQVVCVTMVPSILASPKLRAGHCDRLLKVLGGQEARLKDGFGEAVRAEYVAARTMIRDLVRNQTQLAARLGLKPGESVVKAIVAPALRGAELPSDADALLARTSTAELARAVRELDGRFRTLLGVEGLPGAERWKRITAIKPIGGEDLLSRALQAVEMSALPLTEALSRADATVAATECLVVLRRWQLLHRGLPRALGVAVKEANLKSVPIDPYDGKPMRLAVIDGQPVIYSVGKDGKDDGGVKDSDRDVRPAGDLIYRLPTIEERRGIRPT